jgi:mannosylglycoprotein endo-beta-mannosidase
MTNEKGDTGDGPYGILEPADMFTKKSYPFNPEIGSIGIPNYDGLKKIIPLEEMQVPLKAPGHGSWAYHKYHSFQDFPDRYGKVKDVEDYCRKAQIVSYEQYRALQESFNYKMWEWYSGMLVWKNQNPWTALRGSFYDYYLDYQGGYFGYKHGAVPLHVQLNLNDSSVCVVNQMVKRIEKIIAVIRLFDLHGKLISEKKKTIDQEPQSTRLLDKIILPKTGNGLFFLRLQILDDKGGELDENLYWLTAKPKSYEALNELEPVKLEATTEKIASDKAQVTISNPTKETAFFIRLKVVDEKGVNVLPVFLDENYFTLLPGESRKVGVEVGYSSQMKAGMLKVIVEGWNTEPFDTNL